LLLLNSYFKITNPSPKEATLSIVKNKNSTLEAELFYAKAVALLLKSKIPLMIGGLMLSAFILGLKERLKI